MIQRTLATTHLELYWLLLVGFAFSVTGAILGFYLAVIGPLVRLL